MLEIISAGRSIRQISKGMRSDCEGLCVATKPDTFSPGEPSSMSRFACAIGIQTMSEIMKTMRAFTIGAEESNKYGQADHLDRRIRVPSVAAIGGVLTMTAI